MVSRSASPYARFMHNISRELNSLSLFRASRRIRADVHLQSAAAYAHTHGACQYVGDPVGAALALALHDLAMESHEACQPTVLDVTGWESV